MGKRYEQYCPVAHALDVVGDRWALLVVRELTQGPKRYTDLADGLPGIGTNILAARLRDLEAAGIVMKRTLPPPAASRVYELTDYGLELKPVMRELALWGARSLGPPTAEDELFPGWLVCPIDMIPASATRSRRSPTGSRTPARSTIPTSSSKVARRGCTTCSSTVGSTASRSRATARCSSS